MHESTKIDSTELNRILGMIEILDKSIQAILGDRMDPVEADLNRHLSEEEDARLIRERAENAVLRRFKFDGPDPEEVLQAIGEMSQLQWGEIKNCFRTHDDARLGELIRRLTEDVAIEDEIRRAICD